MGVLRCDHPDIENFIHAKDTGALTNFNISIGVTDTFVQAVIDERDKALAAGFAHEVVAPEALDATAVLQVYSRLVIDCNRQPEWATSIPAISELTLIPGNENIAPEEREARRRAVLDFAALVVALFGLAWVLL